MFIIAPRTCYLPAACLSVLVGVYVGEYQITLILSLLLTDVKYSCFTQSGKEREKES